MTWQVLVTVFTLGGLGAMVRGSITMILASSARIFPMAILIVNLLAAYLGGFLLQLSLPEGLNAAIAIGLIGGIGTLSSIHGNILDLLFDKAYRRLALYLGLTIFGGVLCAYAGMGTGNFVVKLLQGPQNLQQQMMLDTLNQQKGYLESLQEGGAHFGHDLPQLSPLPEGDNSFEESMKSIDALRNEFNQELDSSHESTQKEQEESPTSKDNVEQTPSLETAPYPEQSYEAPVEQEPEINTEDVQQTAQAKIFNPSIALGA